MNTLVLARLTGDARWRERAWSTIAGCGGRLRSQGRGVPLMAAALAMILVWAPREITMGDVQRIVYLHVAVAWGGLA